MTRASWRARNHLLLLGVASALALACHPPSSTPVEVELSKLAPVDTVTLPVGGAVRLEPVRTLVRFEAVLQDSRCPVDVTCVWMGSVRARLLVSENAGGASRVELESNGEPRSAFIAGRELRIVGVRPELRDPRPVEIDLEIRLVAREP